MSAVIFISRLDASGLNSILAAAREFNRRTPSQAANIAGGWIAYRWLHNMPKASIGTMDVELGTAVVLQPKKIGTGFKRAKRTQKFASGRTVSLSHGSRAFNVPLAAAIIQASVIRPDIGATPSAKRYNFLTNFRFARLQSPFRGVSRATGAAMMRAAVHRLIAARHSSSAFLKSAVGAAYRTMRPFLKGYSPGAPPSDFKTRGQPKGHAIPATEANPTCLISADIGMAGTPSNQLAKYNEALWRYGAPALQSAIDTETSKATEYVGKKFAELVANPARAMGAAR